MLKIYKYRIAAEKREAKGGSGKYYRKKRQ